MGNEVTVNGQAFDDSRILSGSCYLGTSLISDELAVDTLEVELDGGAAVSTLFLPAGAAGLQTQEGLSYAVRPYVRVLGDDLAEFSYGTPVDYRYNGALIGRFYLTKVERTAIYTYTLSCTSAMGLLAGSTHYGGLYRGESMEAVLADVMGGAAAYELDPVFRQQPVYGWLPVASRRDNLQQLLFAMGCSMKKKEDGGLLFTLLRPAEQSGLSGERLYMGGTVEHPAAASRAEVTEHAYHALSSTQEETLFEGEVGEQALMTPKGLNCTGALVVFDGPMHSLTAVGGTILEQGVNYAVLGQSAFCRLTGKAYAHTSRVITAEAPAARSLVSVQDNVVRVTDATLVSLANSGNTARRCMAYYGGAAVTRADLVVGGERPGDAVQYEDPFGGETAGFIRSLDVTLSGVLRAAAELVSGYEPGAVGNNYRQAAVLNTTGTWTAPEDVTQVRAVLIGAGSDGEAGTDGEQGEDGSFTSLGPYISIDDRELSYSAAGGKGGKGGKAGGAGKVFVITMDVTPGQSYSVTLGQESAFAGHSSAEGEVSGMGYTDIFSGVTYALPGQDGVDGGAGGGGEDGKGGDVTAKNGTVCHGGVRGSELEQSYSSPGGGMFYNAKMGGGSGGGAADGADGADGQDAWTKRQGWNVNVYEFGAGAGGKGADGADGADGPSYGSGGNGGSGGGGGGAGGPFLQNGNVEIDTAKSKGGVGGKGGRGGKGASGCVILYY